MRFLFLTLLLQLCLSVSAHAAAKPFTAVVGQVFDGDTFITSTGQTIRLLGINTPEPSTGRRPAEAGGDAASRFTKKLLSGQSVTIQPYNKDRYGRTLAHVYLGKVWVNEHLVRQGQAHVYTFPDNRDNVAPLLTAEAAARKEKLGLWSLPHWRIRPATTCCKASD
ncbi:MAG: thermonuclease family protein, partial [Alphaproteobacteria bacterium]